MIKGHATAEGTQTFRDRFTSQLDPAHFREAAGLSFSSIGIGSYLGDPDHATDALYEEALKEAVQGGVNVVDTAINYRCQRSERSFGRSLAALFQSGICKREEIILCTKGGFLPFDGEYPANPPAYFKENYIDAGLLKETEVVEGCHAMTPAFLEDQLQRSLRNLGVETIDVYYVHNPETQLAGVSPHEFRKRMGEVFGWLEKKVQDGKIRFYGTATWNAYRVEEDKPEYLSLEDLHLLAREAAGREHHFKFVQAPLNFAMPEIWVYPAQRFGAGARPLLELASRLGISVIASASLLQARLAEGLPDFLARGFKDLERPSQQSIQFARSVPGITTALVGMKQAAHVRENLKVAAVPPLKPEELQALFQNAT